MTNNNIKEFFVTEKPFQILRKLNEDQDWYTVKLANHTEGSRPHVRGIVGDMEEFGLVTIGDNHNGKKPLELTDKGEELAREFNRLDRVFDEVEQK